MYSIIVLTHIDFGVQLSLLYNAMFPLLYVSNPSNIPTIYSYIILHVTKVYFYLFACLYCYTVLHLIQHAMFQ